MIEILVVRDPDMADEVTVWRDGDDITDECAVIVVDAGAGWVFGDWRESADSALAAVDSAAARAAVEAAYADPPGQAYIDGFKVLGSPPMFCSVCDRYGNEDDGIEVGGPCQYADDENDPCDGVIQNNWEDPR
jgi:hypothetical protein